MRHAASIPGGSRNRVPADGNLDRIGGSRLVGAARPDHRLAPADRQHAGEHQRRRRGHQAQARSGLSRSSATEDRDVLRARRFDQGGGREARLQLALHASRRKAAARPLRGRILLPVGLESPVRPARADGGLGPRELLRLVGGPPSEPHQNAEPEKPSSVPPRLPYSRTRPSRAGIPGTRRSPIRPATPSACRPWPRRNSATSWSKWGTPRPRCSSSTRKP